MVPPRALARPHPLQQAPTREGAEARYDRWFCATRPGGMGRLKRAPPCGITNDRAGLGTLVQRGPDASML